MPDALQSQTAGAHPGKTREGVQTGSISRMMTSQRCCQKSSCPLHARVEVSARRSVHSGPQLRPLDIAVHHYACQPCVQDGSLTCNPQTLRRCCQQCARSMNPCCRIPPASQLRIPLQSRRCPAQTTLTPGDYLFIHIRECHFSSLQVFLIESTLYRGKSSLLQSQSMAALKLGSLYFRSRLIQDMTDAHNLHEALEACSLCRGLHPVHICDRDF
jgi:hypothetical protein